MIGPMHKPLFIKLFFNHNERFLVNYNQQNVKKITTALQNTFLKV